MKRLRDCKSVDSYMRQIVDNLWRICRNANPQDVAGVEREVWSMAMKIRADLDEAKHYKSLSERIKAVEETLNRVIASS